MCVFSDSGITSRPCASRKIIQIVKGQSRLSDAAVLFRDIHDTFVGRSAIAQR